MGGHAYETFAQLGVSTGSWVYKARHATTLAQVLVKLPPCPDPSPAQLAALRREHELLGSLAVSGIARPVTLLDSREPAAASLAIVLEAFEGESLERVLSVGALAWQEALRLGRALAQVLLGLHAARVVHKDFRPANFLVDSERRAVCLVDVSVAAVGGMGGDTAPAPDAWPYVAPEQTGRLNRAVDHRADFYALGVTLYRMLTGRLPFEAADALEWIHCHVARMPRPPLELADMPQVVSDMVMKLLAKSPDDRYQSASGLLFDMDQCLAAAPTEPFELGRRDVFDQLQISQKLYGRGEQLAALRAAFEHTRTSGQTHIALISGPAGSGKTALVHELHRAVVMAHGSFIAGKFDQHRRDVPYATLALAFGELVKQILSAGEARIAAWRERLIRALGPHAQLIIDLIAPLALVMGKQPPVPALPPKEAQNRFRMVFQQFVGVCARPDHPLVLFVDDLQWADAASLDLLVDLSSISQISGLLVVAAYRDDEVQASHPIQPLLDQALQEQTLVTNIVLGPLAPADLQAFVGDTLHQEASEVAALADLLGERTGGNAFFSIQFLLELASEEMLTFDRVRGAWGWKLDAIRAKGYTRNVVDLMVGKLARLPLAAQQALQHAACLGNRVEPELLTAALGKLQPEVERDLAAAVQAGLLHPADGAYRFAHDRVQEAAYSLIPEAERCRLHLGMGRLLLAHLTPAALNERIFDVVHALNQGAGLITDPGERAMVRRLDMRAGHKAKAATAYASAEMAFAQAAALLPESAWQAQYEETFDAYFEWAECRFLVGNFKGTDELLGPLFRHARSRVDRTRVHVLKTRLCINAGRIDEAVAVVLEALRLFGLTFPDDADAIAEEIRVARQDIAEMLQGRNVLDLVNAPPLPDDSDIRAEIGLITDAMAPVYMARPMLYPLLGVHVVRLSLQHGNCLMSVWGYGAYANVLAARFLDTAAASMFAELAVRVGEKLGNSPSRTLIFAFVGHWYEPFSACRLQLDRALTLALDVGDVLSAGYSKLFDVALAIEQGVTLDTIIETSARYRRFVRPLGPVIDMDLCFDIQFARCLKGLTHGPNSLDDDDFKEADGVALFAQVNVQSSMFFRHVLRQVTSFHSADYASALEFSLQAAALAEYMYGVPCVPSHHLFHLLSLAALYPEADAFQQEHTRKLFLAKLPMFETWARNCPQNYRSRCALAQAEFARIEGRDGAALQAYEQAIESAHENGNFHIEALACELAARFHAGRHLRIPSDAYLCRARACYGQWGADGKVRQLDAQHPQLRHADGRRVAVVEPEMLAIVKMSQAISSQIDLDELLDTLMRIALETAGADKGLLLLAEPKGLSLVAEATVLGQAIEVRTHRSAEDAADELPMGILNYVGRSRETLMLADAAQPSVFSNDPYVARRRPRSVLCLPLLRRADLIGVLYLEHGLVSQAFTAGQAELLGMLASQAAISLETARLYASLQEREARIRRLLDANLIGILFFDLSGGISEANDALLRMVGVDREDLRSGRLKWSDLTPPDYHALDLQKVAEVRSTGTCTPYEKEYIRRDGSRVPVLIGAALFEGSQQQGVAFVLDLSERKQAEVEREARRVAELANRAKSEFLANMSHELRTPLNAILGYAQLLKLDAGLSDRQARGLDTIKQGGDHLLALIVDILDLSRVEAGRLELYPTPVDLGDFLDSVVDIARVKADQKALVFVSDVAPEAIGTVLIDEKRLRQVLLNLLSNAVKFTERGQVTLRLHARPAGAKVQLRFEVHDSGIGMDEGQLARLFQPFEQVSEMKHREGGTGLGLAISRKLVRLMESDIRVRSQVGQGSVFSFDIEVPRTADHAAVEPRQRGSPIGYQGARKTVLVVDDVAQNRAMLTDALEQLGFEVSTASDGAECLDAVRAARPDVIIMDLTMPVMDGWEATRRIRLMPALADVPIIATSASVSQEVGMRSRDVGADAFLPKPIEQNELLTAMGRLMQLVWVHKDAPSQPVALARSLRGRRN